MPEEANRPDPEQLLFNEAEDGQLLDPSYCHIRAFDHDTFVHELLDLLDIPESATLASSAVKKAPETESDAAQMQAEEKYIAQLLLQVGVPPHMQGYKFLCQAVSAALRDPCVLDCVSQKLYPSIAQQFGVTASSVERSIRHAIAVAWEKTDAEHLRIVHTLGFRCTGDRPANREFLALAAERVRLKMLGR